jgi:hypothetical protein
VIQAVLVQRAAQSGKPGRKRRYVPPLRDKILS